MASRRVLVLVVLLALLGATPGFSLARQDASPEASPSASPGASPAAGPGDGPLDLAAMVLERGDLPSAYELASEGYADAEQFSVGYTGGAIPVEALEEVGFIRFYESQYYTADGAMLIRSYASEYATEEGAAGGFELLEDESGLEAGLQPGDELEDQAGPDVGADPKEVTVLSAAGFGNSIDTTFRVGNVIVGVAVETSGATEADAALAEDLAPVLFERAEAVTAGEAPEGVDLDLPPLLLPLDEVGQAANAGYLRASEVIDEAGEAGAGYIQSVGFGFPSDPTIPVAFVTAGVLEPDIDDVAAALEEIEASEIVTVLPFPEDSPRVPISELSVDGADAVVATRGSLLPGGFVDSARIAFAVEDRIGIVEVAGAATAAEAETTAIDLAERQAACLTTGDPCTDAPTTEELQTSTLRFFTGDPATPDAELPVGEGEVDRQAVFDEVWTTIKQNYVYRTGTENAFYVGLEGIDWGAVRAEYEPRALAAESDDAFYTVMAEMVAVLDDDHSRFLSPEEARQDDEANAGEATYTGIGAAVIRGLDPARSGTVLYVYPDSPAEAAGIQVRDRIVGIDGQPYTAEAFAALGDELAPPEAPEDTAATPAAGDADPTVQLTVVSPGEAPRDLSVGIGTGPALFSPVALRLDASPGIGYLQIPELSQPDMGQQIEEGLAAMLEEGELDGLIIDLRSNPGGYFDPVINQFVSGEVGRDYSRDGARRFRYIVSAGRLTEDLADVPLVVLVDNRSNSAAEIAAAVLQEKRGAQVVGVRSPGNVESVPTFDFSDGSRIYLAYTTFRVDGQDVEYTGVVPDVPITTEWTAYPESEDPHILAAAELLEGDG